MRVGNCCKCGGQADWNSPCIDKQLNLYCDSCAMKSPIMLYGIEQVLTPGGNYQTNPAHMRFVKNGCIISATTNFFGVGGRVTFYLPLFIFHAYTHDGRRTYRLTDEEKEQIGQDPEIVLDKMAKMVAEGRARCSDCGTEMNEDEIAGFPLFTAVSCDSCYKKHLEHLEDERRKGHVCGRCGHPYGDCCC